jgi:phosphoesterase RecJ-like protein
MNEIHSYIQHATKVAIFTHQSPDGDAMGSSLAMYHYVRSLGKTARVIVPNAFPDFLAWMPGADTVWQYDTQKQQADSYLAEVDLVICTDFNDPKRIGEVGDRMQEMDCPKVLIDHHLNPTDFADFIVSVPEASSTCELVYEVIGDRLGDEAKEHPMMQASSGTPLRLEGDEARDIATCVYTGLMTDTGNFSYNSNRAQIYPMIAQLIEAGVDKDAIYNAVFNQYSVDRMKMVGYCLYQKMRVFPENHAALIYLNRKELYRFNFQKGDAEGIVNMPMQSKDIHYSVFMREDKATPDEMAKNGGIKTKIKLSFRSQGDRPVNVFASEVFNGGGHANAAGGEYYGPLAEAVQLFLDNYQKYFTK